MRDDRSPAPGTRPRVFVFIVLAVAIAAGCIRLGFWQLDRLAWRRALNAEVASHFTAPPVPVESLPADSAAMRYRRVTVTGVFDYANEVLITQRIRGGSPGVNLLTPLRVAGRDTAYLVNRGWVYSPNGKDVDRAAWREPDTAQVLAFALPASTPDSGAAGITSPKIMRTLDFAEVQKGMPYPVKPLLLVQLGDTAPRAGIPPRLVPPPPSEGAHKSYAVQWFSFATIALLGAGIFAYNDRRRHLPRVDDT
ncbi:MAG: SURF1 family protein [Gemmatimonadaceae bacterium]|nr:SURF1 family protein [Gemmatimonadaceae bacterium]